MEAIKQKLLKKSLWVEIQDMSIFSSLMLLPIWPNDLLTTLLTGLFENFINYSIFKSFSEMHPMAMSLFYLKMIMMVIITCWKSPKMNWNCWISCKPLKMEKLNVMVPQLLDVLFQIFWMDLLDCSKKIQFLEV